MTHYPHALGDAPIGNYLAASYTGVMGTVSGARPQAFDYVARMHAALAMKGWWHSFELPDGSRIDGVNSLEGLRYRIGQFPIPPDLTGKRVLDIGCWDGWFSFECERRGAEVVAIDCWDNPRFHEIHAIYRSKVDYRQMDMYSGPRISDQAIR